MPRPTGAQPWSLVLGGAGGLLIMFSASLPWSESGAGSTLALRRVGDLVLSGTVDGWIPRGLGVAVYLVPLGGALVLIGTGLTGRLGSFVSIAGLAIAAAGALVVIGALDRLNRSGLGGGTLAAGIGAALASSSVVIRISSALRRGEPVPSATPPASPPESIVEVHK